MQIDHIYSGSLYGPTVEAMRACDASGPLMINIVKLFPTPNGEQFLAFGRVFSGTVIAGQTVRVLGAWGLVAGVAMCCASCQHVLRRVCL